MWIAIGIAIIFLVVLYFSKRINTYTLIARNTTYIYEILSTDFKDKFPNEDILMATSGVIDALKYVMEGSLTVDDIAIGVRTSQCGKLSLNLINLDITNNPSYHFLVRQPDILYFVYFVMQLEALIFHIATRVPPEHVLSAVKAKKRIIVKEIKRTKIKYKANDAPLLLKKNTYSFMNDEVFAGLRDELGLINNEDDITAQDLEEAKQAIASRGQHYIFVHQVLRDLFFEMPDQIINIVTSKGAKEALLDLWHRVGNEVEETDLTLSNDLYCEVRTLYDDIIVVLVTLPIPKFMCEAYYVAIVHRPYSTKYEGMNRFFVLEKSSEGSLPFLCEWHQAGHHANMGPIRRLTIENFFEEVCSIVQPVNINTDNGFGM